MQCRQFNKWQPITLYLLLWQRSSTNIDSAEKLCSYYHRLHRNLFESFIFPICCRTENHHTILQNCYEIITYKTTFCCVTYVHYNFVCQFTKWQSNANEKPIIDLLDYQISAGFPVFFKHEVTYMLLHL